MNLRSGTGRDRGRGRSAPDETGVTWERRRARMVLPVLLVLAVLSAVVLGFVSPIRQLLAQERRIDETRAVADDLDARNDHLDERVQQLQRDVVVEQIAREELGLVKPGEEAYVLVPPRPGAAVPAPPAKRGPEAPAATTTTAPPPSTLPPGEAPPTTAEPGMSKYADLDPGPG